MHRTKKPVLFMLVFSGIILLIFLVMQPLEVATFLDYIAILNPKGLIGLEERNLLLIIQAIMLLVVIPVYLFTFIFSWKYRADKKDIHYDPDLVDNRVAEYFWWGIPTVLTIIIGILTYIKTAELDPYKPIASTKKTKTIQVIALQWKWLFIYPEEQIASVNFFQIPVDTPIRFEITADAPMNSFWIPHLGGQIYAMPGMRTLLHLIANEPGEYRGSSANLSGEGFAGMTFVVKASTEEEFQKWALHAKNTAATLDYQKLAKPSSNAPVAIYQAKPDLFQQIMMKYMAPME
ncbi:MAG: COX aromatic rich motif-containing protein [Chlamydiales bacterium]|nr:COX aromatic rich motif-containing protein [Chlamydiales bacterium]